MFLTPVLFLFVAKTAYGSDMRIINGTSTQQGEFNFVVSLKQNGDHSCGGSILNENHILTAAHCFCCDRNCTLICDASNFTIQFGQATLTADSTNVISVSEIIMNPQYTPDSHRKHLYDVAVLKLTTPLPSDNTDWETVQLCRNFTSAQSNSGMVLGWGHTCFGGGTSGHLHKATVDIYSEDDIKKHIKPNCKSFYSSFHHIGCGMQNGSACVGDAGSPLLVDGSQVGISSFGYRNCSVANNTYPNVYANVGSYYDWILDKCGHVGRQEASHNDGNYKRLNCVLAFMTLATIIFSIINKDR